MSDTHDRLRTAFTEAGYTVGEVTTNRDQIRVTVVDDDAGAEQLRGIVHDAVGETNVFGLNVATENVEGYDGVQTVVTFRNRF